MLSPDVRKRLEKARQREKTYRPNEEVGATLKDKTIVMFVGPVAAGKSYLMNHVTETDQDFARTPVFTTREARPDDEPGMFRTIPHDDNTVGALLDDIEAGMVVQYAVHPTSGRLYGSTESDYSAPFNMLATLSGTVAQLQGLPFKNTVIIGVAVAPKTWQKRLEARYPTASEEKSKRLQEARLSLEWLLSRSDVRWIDNTGTDTSKTCLLYTSDAADE